ncbi:MAG: hypothetical protein WKF73_00110 [Nocardioidaceae bacterium]
MPHKIIAMSDGGRLGAGVEGAGSDRQPNSHPLTTSPIGTSSSGATFPTAEMAQMLAEVEQGYRGP